MNLPELTLPQMLREQARLQPDRIAIRQKDFGIWKPITWRTYFERASAVGLGLCSLGIGLRNATVAMTGAAPIPAKVVRFFRTIGVPLVEVYGATETSGVAAGQSRDALVPLCVGTAAKGVELARGQNGELLVRGDAVFAGYYKNEAATRAAIDEDGWLHTGDVVEIVEGQFKIVDRLKDIIITAGGKNLSPSEIENTVKGSPFVKECIVIGEARKYVSALIQIDAETVGQWAEATGVTFTHFRSLAEHAQVRALIEGEIAGLYAGA